MSPADEIAALRAELAAQRRRGRVVAAVALAALVGVAVLAARDYRRAGGGWDTDEARAARVEAQAFHLLDPNGNLRGQWSCPPAGPFLTLRDESGRAVLVLRQTDEGGTLRITDANGQVLLKVP
jgi:hypothetical protein